MKIVMNSTWMLIVCVSFACAADLGGYTFLKISGSDGRAVVETPQGEKQLVSPGDLLGEMRITEIMAERVVLEQLDEYGHSLLIVAVKNGRQQVRRLQKRVVQEKVVNADLGENSKKFGQ